MENVTGVIFDLDGTLVDSAPAVRDIANTFMRELGCRPLDLAEVKGYIGNGAAHFLELALAARGIADPALFPARLARYLQIYAAAPGEANVPMPGVDGALRALVAEGCRLAVCTNKPGAATEVVLRALGWQGLLTVVISGDTLPERKPDPAPVREAVRRLGAGVVVYVGDSEVDAMTATAAGLPFILYTEGYRKAAVGEMVHAAAFSDYAKLPALVQEVGAKS